MNSALKLITVTALATAISLPALADFREGLAAYRAGDHARAAKLWQADATNGDAAAQRNLGLLYLRGQGVPQDSAIAANWFQRAAEQSFAPAAANLADLYLKGNGVVANRTRAAEYMRIAADGGLAESQHNLGIFYEHGVGVDRDPQAAVFWYKRAAAQNFQKSIDRLAVLRPGMKVETDDRPARETSSKVAPKPQAAAPAQAAASTKASGDGLVDRLIPLFSQE